MTVADSVSSETDVVNPIMSFRNFGRSQIMTRDQTAELLFTLFDDGDDTILSTTEAIILNKETCIDDVTFNCIWELLKAGKQIDLESEDSTNWIMNACRTHCSRCRVKKQNYEYIRRENGKLLHWCLSC